MAFLTCKSVSLSKIHPLKWDRETQPTIENPTNTGFINSRALSIAVANVREKLKGTRVVPVNGAWPEGLEHTHSGVKLNYRKVMSPEDADRHREMDSSGHMVRAMTHFVKDRVEKTFTACTQCPYFNVEYKVNEFTEAASRNETIDVTANCRCGIMNEAEVTALVEGRACPDGYIPTLSRWRKPKHRLISVEMFAPDQGMVKVVDHTDDASIAPQPGGSTVFMIAPLSPAVGVSASATMSLVDSSTIMEEHTQEDPLGNVGRALGEEFYVDSSELQVIQKHTKITVGYKRENGLNSANPTPHSPSSEDAW